MARVDFDIRHDDTLNQFGTGTLTVKSSNVVHVY